MPYDVYDNRSVMDAWNNMASPVVLQPVLYEQPIQREQAPQPSTYQLMMSLLPNAKYLGDDYKMDKWLADDEASGVTNPLVRMMRYDMFAQPLIDLAREDEIRESFTLASNPNTDPLIKTEALAKLAYYMKNPDLVNETNLKRMKTLQGMGLMENPNYSGGDSEYGGDDQNARQIFAHLKSKGLPDNVIAGIMGNLQQESGFNPAAVGDGGNSIGLAQWYQGRGLGLKDFASQRGMDWNHLPTLLDYLLDEVGRSYPDLIKQMSSMNPHDAAILFHDVFEKSADTPEMKAVRGKNAEAIFNGRRTTPLLQRYIADPNYVSPREQYNRRVYEADRDYARRVYEANRKYDALLNRDALRYGIGGKNAYNLNKNNVAMRKSALELSNLQNVNSEDEEGKKQYDKSMGQFSDHIANICANVDDGSMDSVSFGIALYNELNKTRSGLTPETLSEGVARAVFAQRGDINAEELQGIILNYVYNGGQLLRGTNSVADFKRYNEQNPYNNKILEMADSRRNSRDNAFR